MIRVTLDDFRKMTSKMPGDSILCMYSDSEGNSQSTCLGVYTDYVGRVEKITDSYTYTTGAEIYGIDLESDKNRPIIILQPSL